jgi:hypothetical protein
VKEVFGSDLEVVLWFSLNLMLLWPELSYQWNCKDGWEMQFSCVSWKRRKCTEDGWSLPGANFCSVLHPYLSSVSMVNVLMQAPILVFMEYCSVYWVICLKLSSCFQAFLL